MGGCFYLWLGYSVSRFAENRHDFAEVRHRFAGIRQKIAEIHNKIAEVHNYVKGKKSICRITVISCSIKSCYFELSKIK